MAATQKKPDWRKMKVKNVVKNDDDVVVFEGELSSEEHDLVITVGLNFLYAQGLLGSMAPNIDATQLEGTETVN